jgi:exopolysaccharide production protein ExoZ
LHKLSSIQALRGIAATAVVVHHAWPAFRVGAAGVDLFFVISGFIIGTVMAGRSASEFAVARLWRIYPIYYVNLLIFMAIGLLAGASLERDRLLTSLTLWPVWSRWEHPYLPTGWTLSFEMLFYGITTLALAIKLPRLIAPVILVLVAANLAIGGPLLNFVGAPIVLEFLAGLALIQTPRDLRFGIPAMVIGLALLALLPDPIHGNDFTLAGLGVTWERVATFGIPAVLLAYGAMTLEPMFKRARSLIALGDASYSIYLSHLLVVIASPFWWPVTVVLCLAVGVAMHRYIEKFLIGRRRKPWGRSLQPQARC